MIQADEKASIFHLYVLMRRCIRCENDKDYIKAGECVFIRAGNSAVEIIGRIILIITYI